MGGREPRLVHRALDRIGQQGVAQLAGQRRPAGVAGQRRREHVVTPLEHRQHELPRAPRVGEAVQADERRAGSAAVERGEGGPYADSLS